MEIAKIAPIAITAAPAGMTAVYGDGEHGVMRLPVLAYQAQRHVDQYSCQDEVETVMMVPDPNNLGELVDAQCIPEWVLVNIDYATERATA